MNKDKGASSSEDRAVVNGAARVSALRASVPSADASRGVARQTLVRIGRQCVNYHAGADCNEELVGMIREASRRVTGGNCSFADDDLAVLTHLAERAVEAGLTDGLNPGMARSAAQAIEARRAATGTGAVHESADPQGCAPGEQP